MAYINIPSLNYNNLKFSFVMKHDNNHEKIFISHSLNHYLSNIKQQIEQYNTYWDYYKKITNPYEFIHTQVPDVKLSICKYKPLSRSFFKMIEIINTFSFLTEKNNIKCFHLAEGPGGFIEAFNYKRNNKNDLYYAMTLISDDMNIPSWKKSSHFINNNKNVIIEYGSSNTGDLFLKENLLYCYQNYANSMNYITADGGFDFSVDFNKQEDLSMKLIVAQIFFAIIMQKEGGNFVLKIFDIFKFKTVEIIFLLSNLYDYVYIYKPYTSRVANSEKYIVCKNYKNSNPTIVNEIIHNFDYVLDNINNIYSLFNITFPKLFLKKIEEINAIYGQQQIENINTTLNLIREYINIKFTNYITSDESDIDDNENIKDYHLNDLCNIIVPIKVPINKSQTIPIENSQDTELVNDLFKLDTANNSYTSPILNPQTKFCFINTNDFELNNYIIDVCNEKISSKNKEEEILYTKVQLSKINFSSNSEKFTNKLNSMKTVNIQKSVNWCNKYNFTMNKQFLNI
tara:strand:- start:9430 stop:10968 length:1539 start_codon:yes stop_codon:yes gene_type:complete